MKEDTPHPKNLRIRLSECCNAKTCYVPACFGDPSFTYCDNCKKECTVVYMPAYEEVAKGTWRKIDYKPQSF